MSSIFSSPTTTSPISTSTLRTSPTTTGTLRTSPTTTSPTSAGTVGTGTSGFQYVGVKIGDTTVVDRIIFVMVVIMLIILVVGLVLFFTSSGCTTSQDCTNAGSGLFMCDPSSNTCVECITDTDCQLPKKSGSNVCVNNVCKCGTNDRCTSPKNVCLVNESDSSTTCVQCQVDSDCTTTTPNCDTSKNICYGCDSSLTMQDPNQCPPGYTCSSDGCLPNQCLQNTSCAPGQTCSNGICTGATAFNTLRNVDYVKTAPGNLLLDIQNNTTPLTCSYACYNDPSCSMFNWTSDNGTCYLYTSTGKNTEQWDSLPIEQVTSGTSWGGTRKSFLPTTCNTFSCSKDAQNAFIIPNARINNAIITGSPQSGISTMYNCIKHCTSTNGCDSNSNNVIGSEWSSDKSQCTCYNAMDNTKLSEEIVSAPTPDIITTSVSCLDANTQSF